MTKNSVILLLCFVLVMNFYIQYKYEEKELLYEELLCNAYFYTDINTEHYINKYSIDNKLFIKCNI